MRASSAGSPALRAVVAVAGTTLFMVLVAWATLIGPDEVFTGAGRAERGVSTVTRTCLPVEITTNADGTVTENAPDNPLGLPECEAPASSVSNQPTSDRSEAPLWLRILTWTFVGAILAAIAVLLLYVVVIARDQIGPRRRRSRVEAVEFTTLDEPARLVQAITEDAGEQDAALHQGDPRNAIVAAWQRFEVQGASAGVGRHAWETSSEYAIRILDLVAADTGSVNRLAGLYREARFSEHPITEDHRAEALTALDGIRRSLGVRA